MASRGPSWRTKGALDASCGILVRFRALKLFRFTTKLQDVFEANIYADLGQPEPVALYPLQPKTPPSRRRAGGNGYCAALCSGILMR